MFEIPLYIIIIILILTISFIIADFYFFYKYYFVLKPAFVNVGKPKDKETKIEINEYLKERWQEIRKLIESDDAGRLKLIIIEADTIIEDILRLNNLQGETMAALLSEASLHGVLNVGRLWRFHRIRNQLVHDTNFKLDINQARKILKEADYVLTLWGF